jgi:hypothetical protein
METANLADTAIEPCPSRHRVLLDLADGTILSIKDEAAGVYVSALPKGGGPEVSFVLSNRWEESAFLDAVQNSAIYSRNRVDPA